jgi:bacterioferritin
MEHPLKATPESIQHRPQALPSQKPEPSSMVETGADENKAQVFADEEIQKWRTEVLGQLKDSLISELVSIVRYKKLSESAFLSSLNSTEILLHIYEDVTHAHKLSRRIAQLSGEQKHSTLLLKRSPRASFQNHNELQTMVEGNLEVEYKAIAKYCDIMSKIDKQDLTSLQLMEEIMSDEQDHAEVLNVWLAE